MAKQPKVWAFAAIVLISFFYAATIREGHSWGDDFAQYILHARNIAQGIAYEDTGYLLNPYEISLAPPAYPPLTPLLLAPAYAAFGPSLAAFKGVMVLFAVLAFVAIWVSFRDRLSKRGSAVLLLLTGCSPAVWDLKDYIGSDFLFLALFYCSLWLIDRAYAGGELRPSLLSAAALSASMYLAFAARTVGVVLLPAFLFFAWLRGRAASRFTLGVAASTAVLILGQHMLVGSAGGYTDQLLAYFSAGTLGQNIRVYLSEFGALFVNGYHPAAAKGLYFVTLVLAALGLWSVLRKGLTILEAVIPLYLLILLFYPLNQGFRYLILLVPAYFYYVLIGAHQAFSRLSERARPLAAGILAAAIATTYAGAYTKKQFGPHRQGVTQEEFLEVCRFIRDHTAESDRFVFRKPRALTLMTGRSAAIYNPPEQADRMWDFISTIGADYILVADLPQRDFETDRTVLQPFVQQNLDSLEKVFENSKFELYRVRRDRPG